MQGTLEVMVRGAESILTVRARCGCAECLLARRSGSVSGPCRIQRRALENLVAHRLRAMRPRGPPGLARVAEDARRYARAIASAASVGLEPASTSARWSAERPLDVVPMIESPP